jgi:spore coat polysaccharide biosynthesis protein SpsF
MILGILQARISSTRLAGKVLMNLQGKPMILRQIERIQQSILIDKIVVATSTDTTDDELVQVLYSAGVEVRRGPLQDVFERFALLIDEFKPETIVRMTADCPLTDSGVIDKVIASHLSSRADYSSNTLNPTFPDGLDIECFSNIAFKKLRNLELSEPEREHVTMGFYSRPDTFSLNSITQQQDLSSLRWTVDVQEDLDFVRIVYQNLFMEGNNFGQDEILNLISNYPELSRTDKEITRSSRMRISNEFRR